MTTSEYPVLYVFLVLFSIDPFFLTPFLHRGYSLQHMIMLLHASLDSFRISSYKQFISTEVCDVECGAA